MSSHRFPLRPVAIAATLALQTLVATAQTAPAAAPEAATLSTVTVEASADASAAGLPKPFAGGQVATGGRVGILGNVDNMSSPFSATSYTNELIQNQQARSVGDVLLNDPSVRVARGFGNFQESYFIRGFLLGSDSIAYNGLYSLLPRQYISSELFERVEVLRGPSAFLNGASPGGDGIGGAINLLPKRAGNDLLTQVTLGTASGSQLYAAADIARRFGPDNSVGIRVNAAHRDGGTGVDNEDVRLDVASVGLDWRSRNARLSADIGYQDHRLKQTRTNVTLDSTLTSVPSAPDSQTNWAQPWSYSNERDTFGTIRGEYDFTDNVTGWFALGKRSGSEANSLANLTVTNALTGAGTTYRFDNTADEDVKSAEVGVRGTVRTGSVKHSLVASYDYFDSERKNAYKFDFLNTQSTNLYYPTPTLLQPAFGPFAFGGNNLAAPALTQAKRLTSYAVGDTMGFLDETLLVTLGARYQTLKIDNFAYDTGAPTGGNNDSRTSPAAGVVFKFNKQLSAYANYIESLTPGETAPAQVGGLPVLNVGETLASYVAKQKEIGLKYEANGLGATAALFSIEKPRALRNASGVFAAEGQDRHQGIELNAYGEPIKGFRVLGGVTFLDAEQRDTGSITTDGKKVIGVPKQQGTIGLEWDVPGVRGLTFDGRLIATGSSYADSANTLRVPGWGRVDLGARYVTDVAGKLVTLRARIENVADRNYWASVGGYPGAGYLVLGNPRTYSVSASVEF
ncbi:TonB-dependent siderophore receptor [Variovorax sp. Sphag1AA]|uniref:TonB-dependent receptor n=1 Tax=Variovorax sp. Sphag1AA TaxID=2587027 RepID=UPI001617BC96|nr:TonB-dependent receptor [Variovorax sp. Sphag1AA]MBB3180694.1 iron complex outermembrane receptor protein [Variovorax sp. Sphag1AA]